MGQKKLQKPCPPQRLLFASHRPARLSLLATFRPENERRLRSSSLTVSPAHPPRFLRVCPAQPRKRGPALTILRPRKQSFLERFTRRFPSRALPRWGPHKPSPDRQVALLHGQPRDPTPTSARNVVYRPKPAHRASNAAFCATPPAKAGWLTNPDQPEASKPSQPSQQDTKRHRVVSHDKIAIGGSVELAWQPTWTCQQQDWHWCFACILPTDSWPFMTHWTWELLRPKGLEKTPLNVVQWLAVVKLLLCYPFQTYQTTLYTYIIIFSLGCSRQVCKGEEGLSFLTTAPVW